MESIAPIRDGIAPAATTATARRLAEWIAGLELAAIPEATARHAKGCVIDGIARAIGGVGLRPLRILLDVLTAQTADGPVPVPGTDRWLGVTAAAHFGSQAAHALDFDAGLRAGACANPGAAVVPPALAVATARGCSGEALLTAVVAGLEVSLRIGRAIQPSRARGALVMGHAAWQSFGATAAAVKLMDLAPCQIRSAFGLTGAQALLPGLRKSADGARPCPWIAEAHGRGSEAAVLSALLAERGFQGHQEIFDGPDGFWIMSGSDRYRPELAAEALGERWLLAEAPAGGSPRCGFGDAEAGGRFLRLVAPVLGAGRAASALALLRNMERHSAREISKALIL